MRRIPILPKHGSNVSLGYLSIEDDRLVATLNEDSKITKDDVFKIFGNVGFLALKVVTDNGITYYRKLEICAFALFGALLGYMSVPKISDKDPTAPNYSKDDPYDMER